eukprot:2662178-Rhodomonas_salina.3
MSATCLALADNSSPYVLSDTALRAPYAMSGTELAYGAVAPPFVLRSLSTILAPSVPRNGTEHVWYRARLCLLFRYALCSTGLLGYAATHSLRGVRGTDLGYAATRR